MEHNTIDFDQQWDCIQKGIMKLKKTLEGSETQYDSQEYMKLYTTCYNMCTSKHPLARNYPQRLYDKYKEVFEEYITSTVLPSLREKHDECMLRELAKRWANHKVMVFWLSSIFSYLKLYFIPKNSLPLLNEVGLTCFRDLVYDEFVDNAKDAIITLIDKDREGEEIDRSLLKDVIDIYVQMDYYEIDFEEHLIEDTGAYYSRKASNWILEDTCPDYMLKSEEWLKKERDRVSHYLPSSSVLKLVEAVKEAFEIFCNKTVGGSSSSELLATFCDNIPKKGGGDKMGDEAIKETLEKVVKHLSCLSVTKTFLLNSTGRSLLGGFFLIGVLMMIMKGVFSQNLSSSVVNSLPQRWRGWLQI